MEALLVGVGVEVPGEVDDARAVVRCELFVGKEDIVTTKERGSKDITYRGQEPGDANPLRDLLIEAILRWRGMPGKSKRHRLAPCNSPLTPDPLPERELAQLRTSHYNLLYRNL